MQVPHRRRWQRSELQQLLILLVVPGLTIAAAGEAHAADEGVLPLPDCHRGDAAAEGGEGGPPGSGEHTRPPARDQHQGQPRRAWQHVSSYHQQCEGPLTVIGAAGSARAAAVQVRPPSGRLAPPGPHRCTHATPATAGGPDGAAPRGDSCRQGARQARAGQAAPRVRTTPPRLAIIHARKRPARGAAHNQQLRPVGGSCSSPKTRGDRVASTSRLPPRGNTTDRARSSVHVRVRVLAACRRCASSSC